MARAAAHALPKYQRSRWSTADQDFIDVDFLPADGVSIHSARPLLVLFHGLEGSSSSHYARAFAEYAQEQGMDYVVPHFRGCSGEINLAPRAYHSGDYQEIHWILQRLRDTHGGPMLVVGISLGGNALMRWAEESGSEAKKLVCAVSAISAPLDLEASGVAMGRGFNRAVYTRMFLSSMKPRALQKLQQYPALFNREQLLQARDLYEFDNVFTAPLHGFRNTQDYWRRASAKPHLTRIGVPALVVNARNDPFIPAASLPELGAANSLLTLWQPEHGGHVGFVAGTCPPGELRALPTAVGGWMQRHLHRP
jgi:predicted alpha/beta-fold hydrolase